MQIDMTRVVLCIAIFWFMLSRRLKVAQLAILLSQLVNQVISKAIMHFKQKNSIIPTYLVKLNFFTWAIFNYNFKQFRLAH